MPGTEAEPLRRNADFVRLWLAEACSALGSSMGTLVYPLLALATSGSATLAGLMGFVSLGGSSLLRLPAGALIDRLALRPVMVWAQALRAITTGLVALSYVLGTLTFPQLLLMAFLNGVAGAFYDASQSVAIRHVVVANQLPQAFALNEGRGHAVGLAGQPLGGLLYAISAVIPVVFDAVSYLVSCVLIRSVSRPMKSEAPDPPPPLHRDLLSGLRHVFRNPFLRVTMLGAAGFQFVFAGLTLAVIASLEARDVRSSELGVAFAIAAAGGIAGAVLAPRAQKRLRPSTLIYAFGWTAVGALLVLGWTENPYLAGAVLGIVFLFAAPANAMLGALQILVTPPQLQGRVMSSLMLVAGIAAPFGPLCAGFLLESTSQWIVMLTFAIVTAVVTVALQTSRSVRGMSMP